jgi:hypothetical protein
MADPYFEELARSVRRYCRERLGYEPVRIRVEMAGGGTWERKIDLPAGGEEKAGPGGESEADADETPPPGAVAGVRLAIASPVAGCQGIPPVSENYRCVNWYGKLYHFTELQAKVMEVLFAAWKEGVPDVSQTYLLRKVGSDSSRLHDLFRRSEAWDRIIVAGEASSTYRLASRPRLSDDD